MQLFNEFLANPNQAAAQLQALIGSGDLDGLVAHLPTEVRSQVAAILGLNTEDLARMVKDLRKPVGQIQAVLVGAASRAQRAKREKPVLTGEYLALVRRYITDSGMCIACGRKGHLAPGADCTCYVA